MNSRGVLAGARRGWRACDIYGQPRRLAKRRISPRPMVWLGGMGRSAYVRGMAGLRTRNPKSSGAASRSGKGGGPGPEADDIPRMTLTLAGADRNPVLRFGSVEIAGKAPDPLVIEINVESGRRALARAKGAFTNPGIRLYKRKGVPQFRADESEPHVLIRELDGRVERGTIVNGSFVAE